MKVSLLKPYDKQREIINALDTHRYVVASMARRTGKTIVGMNVAILKALEGLPVLWCSISYKQLQATFDMFLSTLKDVIVSANKQQNTIKLINNATISFFSLDNVSSDSIRGKKFGLIVIDECAFVQNLEKKLYSILLPTIVDYQGKVLFLSSPNGYNSFFKLYNKANTDKAWYSLTATTYDNPFIDNNELDMLKTLMPKKVFDTEIMGMFVDSNSGVFSNISAMSCHKQVVQNSLTTIGVDLARSSDNTAMVVMANKHVVEIVVLNDKSFALQVATIKALNAKYKPEVITVESNGLSLPIVEELSTTNLPLDTFYTNNASKKILIETLAVGIEQKLITVQAGIDNEQLLYDELSAYESSTSSSGLVTYNAPPGLHDDGVIALALAYKTQHDSDSSLVVYC